MGIAWGYFPRAGSRSVWWKASLFGCWRRGTSRTSAPYRIFGRFILGRVGLDGSKGKTNASKHRAMSYGRMRETKKRLREEVRKLLSQAEAADAEEDTRYRRGRPVDELPEELQRRG